MEGFNQSLLHEKSKQSPEHTRLHRPSEPSLPSGGGWGGGANSPGLGLPPGHALLAPLGVWGQVVDQLAAGLVGGLDGVLFLQTHDG